MIQRFVGAWEAFWASNYQGKWVVVRDMPPFGPRLRYECRTEETARTWAGADPGLRVMHRAQYEDELLTSMESEETWRQIGLLYQRGNVAVSVEGLSAVSALVETASRPTLREW